MRLVQVLMVITLTMVIAVSAPSGFGLGIAHAQQERPKTLFQLLFKNNQSAAPAKPAPNSGAASTKTNRSGTASRSASAAAPAAPVTPPVEKLENARTILVVGDFTGGTVAGGIEAMFEQNSGVVVVNAANGSSGLVRNDFYDWPVEIDALVSAHEPVAVVMMIGANDRQQMLVADTREAVRSEAWIREYRARATRVARAVTGRNVPLLWVGQVSYSSPSMTADMLAFNDIYRAVTLAVPGAEYVDVWDGFVDEEGKFITRGPDVNGQIVALRSGQVNLTKAGGRKIAFYAEKPLRRILDDPSNRIPGQLGAENLPVLSLELPGSNAAAERLRPVALNGPDLDGGTELLGTNPTPPSGAIALPEATAGRVNAFAGRP